MAGGPHYPFSANPAKNKFLFGGIIEYTGGSDVETFTGPMVAGAMDGETDDQWQFGWHIPRKPPTGAWFLGIDYMTLAAVNLSAYVNPVWSLKDINDDMFSTANDEGDVELPFVVGDIRERLPVRIPLDAAAITDGDAMKMLTMKIIIRSSIVNYTMDEDWMFWPFLVVE